MRFNKMSLTLIVLLLFTGCTYKNGQYSTDTNIVDNDVMTQQSRENNVEDIYFQVGEKIKELSDVSDINDPVIIVNGNSITNKDIESKRIVGEFVDDFSLKETINDMIEEEVLVTEADSLGIEASHEEVKKYIEEIKEYLQNGSAENIKHYIQGRGITEEEYLAMLEDIEYKNYLRTALWEKVKASVEDQIQKEANERNVSVLSVEQEYYKQYVDSLMKKANIIYLDEGVKRIFE